MEKLLRAILWIGVLGALLVAGLRTVFLDTWVVPDEDRLSASVAPTLAGGDIVVYWKRQSPAFGDLVRCTDPDDATRFVVGRVVGLRGDVVDTNGADLVVNGSRFVSETSCKERSVTINHPTTGSPVEIWCDQLTIAGHPHMRGVAQKPGIYTPTHTTVGDGMVFLLSDDRSYHDDSRDFGTVRADTCTGRIVLRLLGKDGWKDDKRRFSIIQ